MIYRNSVCIYLRLEKEDGCPRQHFGFVWRWRFLLFPNFHSTAAQEKRKRSRFSVLPRRLRPPLRRYKSLPISKLRKWDSPPRPPTSAAMLCLTSSSSSAPAPLLPSLADRPSPGIAGGGGNVRLSVVSSPRRSWPGKVENVKASPPDS
uniref:Uncharacterized protein n=1 Tax=Oryza meridionalis TaxID=40149 RepID=A0A0E0E6K6_9ORYZ